MAAILARVGAFSARRRWLVLGVWLLVLVLAVGLASRFAEPLDSKLTVSGLQSTRTLDQVDSEFGAGGDDVWLQPPFFCDFGSNIHLGRKVFFNFNCVVLDVCEVRIGDRTMFGPAAQVYAATHPLDPVAAATTGSICASAVTWQAASSENGPTKTDRRSNIRHSTGDSRP